jgi:hypothetical protein
MQRLAWLPNYPIAGFLFLKTPICLQKQAQNRKKQRLFWTINSDCLPHCSALAALHCFPMHETFKKPQILQLYAFFLPPYSLFSTHGSLPQ